MKSKIILANNIPNIWPSFNLEKKVFKVRRFEIWSLIHIFNKGQFNKEITLFQCIKILLLNRFWFEDHNIIAVKMPIYSVQCTSFNGEY